MRGFLAEWQGLKVLKFDGKKETFCSRLDSLTWLTFIDLLIRYSFFSLPFVQIQEASCIYAYNEGFWLRLFLSGVLCLDA